MRILDNRSHLLGDSLKADLQAGARVKVAASLFSIYAFEALKTQLERVGSFQFIFTTPSFVAQEVTDQLRKQEREYFIPKLGPESRVYGTEFEVRLRNQLQQGAIARECAAWIRAKATFKSNITGAPMQGLAHVAPGKNAQADQAAAYFPLSGFSVPDLGYAPSDAHSSLCNRFDDPAHTRLYLSLFDDLWNDPSKVADVTEALCAYIENVYQENAPERIYFLILYNIFKEFLTDLDQDSLPNARTGYADTRIWKQLYDFQRDGAAGIINKLETYNGCILADSVGLGKTFTALAVIKYYELRNRAVLVLCPKKLADNWVNFNANLTTNPFAADRFNYDVLCHTDLSRNRGTSLGLPLEKVNWGNYDLVVIDESHNFRNNDAYEERESRYERLMNRVMRAGVKTKVLMLSATPVNNRFKDLRNQLALSYEGRSQHLSDKLKSATSIEEIFRKAQGAFNQWAKLPADQRTPEAILTALDFDFFEVLDAVTIARSRKHIQGLYDTEAIGAFPTRLPPRAHRCPLTHKPDVMPLETLVEHLGRLTLAIYMPVTDVLPSRRAKYEALYDSQSRGSGGKGKLAQRTREKGLQALNTTNLLKRLESSVEAFRLTLGNLARRIDAALAAIAQFESTGQGGAWEAELGPIPEMEEEDEDFQNFGASSFGGKIKIDLADMDVTSWKRKLAADQGIVADLLAEMAKVAPATDAKLQQLIAHIGDKVRRPLNAGNRKVLVFTAFADTAKYLYGHLAPALASAHGLSVGLVTGTGPPQTTLKGTYGLQEVLTLFSPHSKDKALTMPHVTAELDVLIATDCISEGQNLQDCDFLINYDIHWNPVRVIQRFGRVDRIGSRNDTIQLVNYWPDLSLDHYINLRERVEDRMVATNLAATGDDNVLTPESSDMTYRRDQLKKLQSEVIDLEDVKTGISITDLGLNDFRMDLLAYVKDHPDLARWPKGLHAVVPAEAAAGLKPGVIFALRNMHDSINVDQQNRLHPYYLIYMGRDGTVLADPREAKRLLDLLRRACKGRDAPLAQACALFNATTADGRDMQAYSGLLNQAIASLIAAKDEGDVDSLFSGGTTTALIDTLQGLDDFELVAFLVIEDTDQAVAACAPSHGDPQLDRA